MGASSSHHVSHPHSFLNNIYSDHGTIHDLFMSYKTSLRQEAQKEAAERIVKELSMLLQTDDVTYIPIIEREIKPDGPRLATRLREINRSIMQKCQQVLTDLKDLDTHKDVFHQHMKELLELCEMHVEFEEKECLPKMNEQLDQGKLDAINAEYNSTKKIAPSRPIVESEGIAGALPKTVPAADLGAGSTTTVGPPQRANIVNTDSPAGAGSAATSSSGGGSVMGVGVDKPANVGATAAGAGGCGCSSGCSCKSGCGCSSSCSCCGGASKSKQQGYYYGSGDKEALLKAREAGDQSKPERVQGEYGPRS